MNIPMPSPEERKKSCEIILKKAYQPSFSRKLYDTSKALGFCNLWVGVEWCVLLEIFFTLLYLYSQMPKFLDENKLIPLELFFVAPLFYGSLLSLTLWKEMVDHVFPLKQSCYFSTAQLTSLRCLCFGGISAVIQGFTVGFAVYCGGKVQLSSLLLSLSLLLLYGGISFFTLRKTEHWLTHGFMLGLWCLISLGFSGSVFFSFSSFSAFSSGILLFFLLPLGLFMGSELKKYFLQGESSC